MSAESISYFIQRRHELPALPQILTKLLDVVSDDGASQVALLEVLGADQVLSARMIELANAGQYGVRNVTSLDKAVRLVGLNRLRDLAITSVVFDAFANTTPLPLRQLWQESLAVAVCCEEVARIKKTDRSCAYLAGLLHGIGRLLLYVSFPDAYLAILEHWRRGELSLHEIEAHYFGCNYAELGAALTTTWGFPAEITEAIASHVKVGGESSGGQLAETVHLGMVLTAALDLIGHPMNRVPPMSEMALARLDIELEEIIRTLSYIEGRYHHMCILLGFGPGPQKQNMAA